MPTDPAKDRHLESRRQNSAKMEAYKKKTLNKPSPPDLNTHSRVSSVSLWSSSRDRAKDEHPEHHPGGIGNRERCLRLRCREMLFAKRESCSWNELFLLLFNTRTHPNTHLSTRSVIFCFYTLLQTRNFYLRFNFCFFSGKLRPQGLDKQQLQQRAKHTPLFEREKLFYHTITIAVPQLLPILWPVYISSFIKT